MGGFLQSGISFRGVLAASGFLAVLATVAGWYGEYAWWLDACAHPKAAYFAVFCLLAIAYARDRRWMFAVGAACFAGVNLMPLWPYIPATGTAQAAPAATGKTRAMMINVNTFYGDASHVAKAIRAERPDLLLLLEVDHRWLSKLKPELAQFPSRLVEPRDDNFGIALFSRSPWDAARVVFVGEANLPSVQARIAVGEARVDVLGTHLPPPVGHRPWALRNDQLAELAHHLRGISGPLLVLGDLNATPWSYHLERFLGESGLEDSAKGRCLIGTWPVFARPFSIPIDHCLHRGGIVVLGRRHGPNVGSDHLPVIVDFGAGR